MIDVRFQKINAKIGKTRKITIILDRNICALALSLVLVICGHDTDAKCVTKHFPTSALVKANSL